MTNLEKIKEMSASDFAHFLNAILDSHDDCNDCYHCPLRNTRPCAYDGIKNWLKCEITDD